ncbi:MAG: hypothetical protein DBX05_01270 [Candidatus Poseidoniales archaeon]|nr:MAG: hypothetical protein CBE15_03370 [Euryarchaeota archaeon TMED255]RAH10212.1 MAG: hypothetical protein CMA23_004625 [Euryarchaeota archaeon]RCH74339.1 MAG: hypothetical protein DBX05_01270 [Candidatus Poseidoniales archaeon]|tara:strand:- start:2771 stop:2971 length:201 start_codon:yes stop_codon:yes gene_type:complete
MRISLNVEGKVHEVDVEPGTTVQQILDTVGILPSTVLVTYDGRIVPNSTKINEPVELETIIVSSGG